LVDKTVDKRVMKMVELMDKLLVVKMADVLEHLMVDWKEP